MSCKLTYHLLQKNDVGVDFFSFDSIDKTEEYYVFLSDTEKHRADQLTLATVYRQYVITRGRLRQRLAEQLGCEPEELVIACQDKGKPYLKNFTYQFNVSHTQGAGIIALSPTVVLGIDIESLQREADIVGVAKHVFTQQEQNFIAEQSDATHAFFRCWTRKEALIKALGEGFHQDLKVVSVFDTKDTMPEIILNAQSWFLQELVVMQPYQVALATNQNVEIIYNF